MELNEIKDLIVKAKESSATTLDLSSKGLTSLPSEITELKNLTELNVSDNQLTSLPPEISELKYLTELEVYANPVENPPLEIVIKGVEALRNYFKSLEEEKRHLNEVKVLLVGDGGAGKTSLMKRIFGKEIDGNEPQTQGINIRKLKVNDGDREIKANLWDFGGQEIMHATHQFFCPKGVYTF